MEQDIGPSTPWRLEGHATDFYGSSQGYSCGIRHMQGMYYGEVCKATFHEKEKRASEIFERVQLDVCGPLSTASTTKNKYYMIFVDDFSRKCWIYFMQKKDQTFSKFCEFKALVEKDTRKKVKALRSDNGGEYISNEFKNFYAKE